MAEKIKFELVAPERLLIDEPVDMVVVPGVEGDFGVLARHAPLIAAVRPGVINVHNEGAVTQRIFVGGGFAEVTAERCTVLADEAQSVAEIDRAATERTIADLSEKLSVADPDERDPLARRLAVARAKLAAAA
jgi:F-type H+-transporting ATPase subunit epsilon